MTTATIERRIHRGPSAARLEHRAGGSGLARITGYAAKFYDPRDPGTEFALDQGFIERIQPGAFDRAIRANDVRALFNHDPSLILGRTGAGTLRLAVDSVGLRYEIDPPDTQAGRDVVESIRRGDVSGSSFAFAAVRTQPRREGAKLIRDLLEVELHDVGPVTYPAYLSATSGVRDGRPVSAAERDRREVILLEVDALLWQSQQEQTPPSRA